MKFGLNYKKDKLIEKYEDSLSEEIQCLKRKRTEMKIKLRRLDKEIDDLEYKFENITAGDLRRFAKSLADKIFN